MFSATSPKYGIAVMLLGTAILAFHCAGQFAPSGGPPDTIPPEVIETYPTAKMTGYRDRVIRLAFTKWMEKRSVDESIFLSPNLGELTLDWSGKEVEITFEDTLRENTTYVLTLGTDVKDLLAGNKMAQAFSLAFSTGDHIDSAQLSGRIFEEEPEGVLLFAYRLDSRNGDTLSPARCKPDYITQTGKDGTFLLPYLRLGKYRLFGIRDEYKNLLYDAQIDEFGLPQQEFTLTADRFAIGGIMMMMGREDTTAPFLSSARPIDQQHVLLRFSETIDTSTLRAENITITDTLTQTPLAIISASPCDTSFSEAILLTSEQESTKTYRVRVTGISDLNKNAIVFTKTPTDFDGSNTADTTKPSFKILNLETPVRAIFPEDSIKITMNEWIVRQKFEHGFSITDSAGNYIAGRFVWQNANHALYIPQSPLGFNMSYSITMVLDSLIDVAGNRQRDSIRIVKFSVVDKDKLGAIMGFVTDSSQTTEGKIFVFATPLAPESRPRFQTLERPGKFSFNDLEEGKFILSAFIDSDSNGVYSKGSVTPFIPSERFIFYSDTLKVRARWSQEGVGIRLK